MYVYSIECILHVECVLFINIAQEEDRALFSASHVSSSSFDTHVSSSSYNTHVSSAQEEDRAPFPVRHTRLNPNSYPPNLNIPPPLCPHPDSDILSPTSYNSKS